MGSLTKIRAEVSTSQIPFLCLLTLRLLIEVNLLSKDYYVAGRLSLCATVIADIFLDNTELLLNLEILGKCNRDLHRYTEAIQCFKKQMFMSWIVKDMTSELSAYDNLGLCHFYLNEPSKAQ